MNKIIIDAKKIIHDAIQASLPDEAVKKAICGKDFIFEGKVIVIAIGKAAWNMAKAASENIPHKIDTGIVLTKYDHSQGDIPGFTILEAGHPLPDENTISGTKQILMAVRTKRLPQGRNMATTMLISRVKNIKEVPQRGWNRRHCMAFSGVSSFSASWQKMDLCSPP